MILLQNYIRTVKIFPSADNFTQALLVMLVTNIMSEQWGGVVGVKCDCARQTA